MQERMKAESIKMKLEVASHKNSLTIVDDRTIELRALPVILPSLSSGK